MARTDHDVICSSVPGLLRNLPNLPVFIALHLRREWRSSDEMEMMIIPASQFPIPGWEYPAQAYVSCAVITRIWSGSRMARYGKRASTCFHLGEPTSCKFRRASPPNMLQENELPIVITVGAKKALAMWRLATEGQDQRRFLPVAISGVGIGPALPARHSLEPHFSLNTIFCAPGSGFHEYNNGRCLNDYVVFLPQKIGNL
jgi:hypothetical protein